VIQGQFEPSTKSKVKVVHPTTETPHQSAKSSGERLQGRSKLPSNVVLDLDSCADLAPFCDSNTRVNESISELPIDLDLERLHLDDTSEAQMGIDDAADAETVPSITSPLPHSSHPKSPDGLWNSMRKGIGSWTEEYGRNSQQLSVTENYPEQSILKAISSMPPELYSQFDKQWLTNLRQCTGRPQQSNRAYSHSSLSPSKSCTSKSLHAAASARSSGDDGVDENNSDDELPQHQGPVPGSASSMTKVFLFACPFHQYDPQYFSASDLNGATYQRCGCNGWKDTSRVKYDPRESFKTLTNQST
jgi:hypothetical protein